MRIDGQDPDPREEDSLVESLDDGDENEIEAAEGDEEELPPEDDAEQEPEPEPAPAQPRGRGRDENMAALRERARAATERAERAERERDEERNRGRQQPRDDGADQAAEAARVAAMSPEDRVLYGVNKAIEAHDRRQQVREFQYAEQNDQRDFKTLIDSKPQLKKYEKEVEDILLGLRRNGQNVQRQVILAKIIGDRVLANAGNTRQRKGAASNVQRNTVQPARNKSDLNGGRQTNERAEREKRLTGVRL